MTKCSSQIEHKRWVSSAQFHTQVPFRPVKSFVTIFAYLRVSFVFYWKRTTSTCLYFLPHDPDLPTSASIDHQRLSNDAIPSISVSTSESVQFFPNINALDWAHALREPVVNLPACNFALFDAIGNWKISGPIRHETITSSLSLTECAGVAHFWSTLRGLPPP